MYFTRVYKNLLTDCSILFYGKKESGRGSKEEQLPDGLTLWSPFKDSEKERNVTCCIPLVKTCIFVFHYYYF